MENKRQHIVPRAYLNRFVAPEHDAQREPSLWVVERGVSGGYRRAPKNVAVRNYYYSHVDSDGQRDDAVDDFLQTIESDGLPILRKLEEGADPASLTEQERVRASLFIGAMAVRIPGFRDTVEKLYRDIAKMTLHMGASHPEYFERTMREAAASSGKAPPNDIESVRRFALEGEYSINVDPVVSLRAMVQLLPVGASYAYNMHWRVLEALADARFITSDRPLVLVSTEKQPPILGLGAGWESPWMEATLPLGPRALLLISLHHPSGREAVGSDAVDEANLRTATFAETVYSSDEIPLERLNRGSDWNWWKPLTSAMVTPDADARAV